MNDYKAAYEDLFVHNLRRYASIRKAIKRRTEKVLEDPYTFGPFYFLLLVWNLILDIWCFLFLEPRPNPEP
ncbi:MAG: hypothetical protein U5L07_10910 [Desulfobacterales bacterium]|nr:hypothetical protein [Desulfobacterales bacterium]